MDLNELKYLEEKLSTPEGLDEVEQTLDVQKLSEIVAYAIRQTERVEWVQVHRPPKDCRMVEICGGFTVGNLTGNDVEFNGTARGFYRGLDAKGHRFEVITGPKGHGTKTQTVTHYPEYWAHLRRPFNPDTEVTAEDWSGNVISSMQSSLAKIMAHSQSAPTAMSQTEALALIMREAYPALVGSVKWNPTHVDTETGIRYQMLGTGETVPEGDLVAIYKGRDGRAKVIDVFEFNRGKFKPIDEVASLIN